MNIATSIKVSTVVAGVMLFAVTFTLAQAQTRDADEQFMSSEPTGNQVDETPLPDLGPNMYLGQFQGGLYPGGSNDLPAGHAQAGIAAADAVQPLDTDGKVDPTNGRIVMISVGMSNTNQEFCGFPSPVPDQNGLFDMTPFQTCDALSFVGQATRSAQVNNKTLAIVNCARGGQPADSWVYPSAQNDAQNNYDICDSRLANLKLSPTQVQVAWVKEADITALMDHSWPGVRSHHSSLPNTDADAYFLEEELGQIVRALKIRYPNIKQVFFSSRIYGGFQGPRGISSEPFAYEGGFAVKWLIQAQIDQMNNGGQVVDKRAGDLNLNYTPWVGWASYLWATNITPRQQAASGGCDLPGLIWDRNDIAEDSTHPARSGVQKVATQLFHFFLCSPQSAPWFSADGRPTKS